MTQAQIMEAINGANIVSVEQPRPLFRELPPADSFPVDAAGSVLKAAAEGIQARTQAPIAMCCQSVLAAATLAVQGHANVELPTGQTRPVSSFFMTIAGSGERKSTVDNEALWAVHQREVELRDVYEIDHKAWLDDNDIWEKERASILNDKKKGKVDKEVAAAARRADLEALGEQPKEPLVPIITCEEPTYEGLYRLFVKGQPSLGVFSAEGGQFIGGHGMSDENKLRTSAGLSKLWDGVPIKRVRSGDGASTLPGRRAAMHLMAQPDVAARMLSDRVLADQGLLSRFLVVAPDSTAGTRFFQEANAESDTAIRNYNELLLQILGTQPEIKEGSGNELAPRVLQMSAEARSGWIGYANHIEVLLAPDGAFESIRGFANKLAEHAARLAAVLTLVEDLGASEVKAEAMANGIVLADFYAAEALRLFNSSLGDPDLLLAEKLLSWLHQKRLETVALPNIYQNGPGSIRTAKEARKIARILKDHGWISEIDGGVDIDGVRHKEAWRVAKTGGEL